MVEEMKDHNQLTVMEEEIYEKKEMRENKY